MGASAPNWVVEWIPYDDLQNVKYLTKGGYSDIYTAIWIGGCYDEWDSREKQLIRLGDHNVILKELENIESANRSWFEEVYNLKYYIIIYNFAWLAIIYHSLEQISFNYK
jgi:hypothetical protein